MISTIKDFIQNMLVLLTLICFATFIVCLPFLFMYLMSVAWHMVASLWLFSGNDDDVFKAQEYVGNIGGKVLTYLAVLYKGDVADAHKQVQEFYDKITLAKLYR